MSVQIDSLTVTAQDARDEPVAAYRVNPPPPWWEPLLQAAEVMARETSGCRSGGHREPGQPAAPAVLAWLNGRR
jgi:hypothetical protein